jgi:hypothetical protein
MVSQMIGRERFRMLTLRELEEHLVQSGKYTEEQIDRMLTLVMQAREDSKREPSIHKPS